MKSYDELIQLKTFEERFEYLKCPGKIGEDTFGYDRWINQKFYTSQQWRNFRNRIIVRDDGCDMALENYRIPDNELITIHHINPITVEDILNRNPAIFDENNVVCVRDKTHKAIHYGDLSSIGIMTGLDGDRYENDMMPWKNLEKGDKSVAKKKTQNNPELETGIVRVSALLNVRSTPEISNNIVDILSNGTQVAILDKSDSLFYKIQFCKIGEELKTGYVMKKFITTD